MRTHWQDLIKYSSVQLVKRSADGDPCGFGSGCLLDYKDRRFLITVFHVAQKSSSWCVRVKFHEDKEQTEVLFLNQFNYLGDFNKDKTKIVDVEFSFHPVRPDFKCYFENRDWRGEKEESREAPVLHSELVEEPNILTSYGFSGNIRPDLLPDQNAIVTDHHIYHGLKYDRTENNMHYFKMPEEHPGHDYFEGCSGAPIIGEDGKVVSLVSGGLIESNEIFGCNLAKCIRTLDLFLE